MNKYMMKMIFDKITYQIWAQDVALPYPPITTPQTSRCTGDGGGWWWWWRWKIIGWQRDAQIMITLGLMQFLTPFQFVCLAAPSKNCLNS